MSCDVNLPLVVVARQAGAIDLTASLLHARFFDQNAARTVLWVTEPTATVAQSEHISSLASNFRPYFNIEQLNDPAASIWARSREDFLKLLDSALGKSAVRIHHGGIRAQIKGSRMEFRVFRRFNGRIEASESGRLGSFIPMEKLGNFFLSGSANLLLVQSLGNAVHVPWYTLHEGNWDIEAMEFISPLVVSNQFRYLQSGPLKPRGYLLDDYLGISQPKTLEGVEWIFDYLGPVSSKGGERVKGVQLSLDRRASEIRTSIINGKRLVGWSFEGELLVDDFALVDVFLGLKVVSRAVERFLRGFGDEDPVIRSFKTCCPWLTSVSDYSEWAWQSFDLCLRMTKHLIQHSDNIYRNDKRIGVLAKRSLRVAELLSQEAIRYGGSTCKATLSALIETLGSPRSVIKSMDSLLERRGSGQCVPIRGFFANAI